MRDILEDAEGAAARGDIGPGKANRERDLKKFPKKFYEKAEIKQRSYQPFENASNTFGKYSN